MQPHSRQSFRVSLWLWLAICAVALVVLPAARAEAQSAAQSAASEGVLQLLQARLVAALDWINGLGAIAPLAFIGLYIVVTVAFVPASVVTLGAGAVFGIVQGSALVFVGAMLGAVAAFLVGRYLARRWVADKIAGSSKFKAIDDAVGREGRKIIFLLRLSPAFPFNLLNYALGLTQISLKDYALGTVGILPGTILYVYLGSLVGNLATLGSDQSLANPQAAAVQWGVRIVGLLATVAITVYITSLARQALKAAVPETTPAADAPDHP